MRMALGVLAALCTLRIADIEARGYFNQPRRIGADSVPGKKTETVESPVDKKSQTRGLQIFACLKNFGESIFTFFTMGHIMKGGHIMKQWRFPERHQP